MTEPHPTDLPSALSRLEQSSLVVKAGLRRNDPACWAGHLELIVFRFRANAQCLLDRQILGRLRAAVDALIRYAVQTDALSCLKVLHARHCSFAPMNLSGRSLLHDAVRRGALDTLCWLIDEQHLDIDVTGRCDITPLHLACRQHRVEILRALLQRHASLETPDVRGETALHHAARAGSPALVHELITAGVNLGASSRHGETALSIAAARARRHNDWSTVALLLDQNAALTKALPWLLQGPPEVAEHPRVRTASLANCDRDQLGALFQTATTQRACELLSRGADARLAAAHALRNRDSELFSAIRRERPFALTPMHYRIASESLAGLRRLLDAGGDPNVILEDPHSDARHPLIYFAARRLHGAGALVALLLQRGARGQAPAELCEEPLIITLVRSCSILTENVRAYVQSGHDINARTNRQRSVLHVLAAEPWHDESAMALAALLRGGADIEARDQDGLTPLMQAIRTHHAPPNESCPGIRAWLDSGADVHAVDGRGLTPLHHLFAARRVQESHDAESVLQILLAHGASIEARTADGIYPEDIGEVGQFQELRNSLRRLRARGLMSAPSQPGDCVMTVRPRTSR